MQEIPKLYTIYKTNQKKTLFGKKKSINLYYLKFGNHKVLCGIISIAGRENKLASI